MPPQGWRKQPLSMWTAYGWGWRTYFYLVPRICMLVQCKKHIQYLSCLVPLKMLHLQPRRLTVSRAASKEGWLAGRGPALVRPHWRVASRPGNLAQERHRSCWSGSKGEPWVRSEGWNTSPVKKDWDNWACSAFRRKGTEETSFQPSST